MYIEIVEYGEICSWLEYLGVNGSLMDPGEIDRIENDLWLKGEAIQDEGAGGVFHLRRLSARLRAGPTNPYA
jgi:hypothetical protein